MDLLKFQASIDAHTAALVTHSAALEKFMAVAASGGAAVSGEVPRGRGRPTNAEKAAQTANASPATGTPVTTTVGPVTSSVQANVANAAAQAVNAATAASNGLLTHQGLAPKVVAFAKAKGRDALVALLGEFGAAEFAKIPADALPLFNDRLDGKPQTPTIASDLTNLLGM